MKSKYDMMNESEVVDKDGNCYPDLATFPIENFVTNTKPIDYKLTQLDCERFFDCTFDFYDAFDFYDDIILWLNDIDYISDEERNFGKTIKMYSKNDINNWYTSFMRGETVKIDKSGLL